MDQQLSKPAKNRLSMDIGLRESTRYLALLQTYLGQSVVECVLNNDNARKGMLTYASVMFADIRSFTTLSEATEPLDLYEQINAYFTMTQEAVRRNGGAVLGFGGDSVLALFGAFSNESTTHALDAIQAAGEMMTDLADLNREREKSDLPPFRMGIGVNTGDMVVGNIGTPDCMVYTVLGDCINTAKRLSDQSKETPFYSIYATNECVEVAQGSALPPDEEWDSVELTIPNRKQPVLIYNMYSISVAGKEELVPTNAISPPDE